MVIGFHYHNQHLASMPLEVTTQVMLLTFMLSKLLKEQLRHCLERLEALRIDGILGAAH